MKPMNKMVVVMMHQGCKESHDSGAEQRGTEGECVQYNQKDARWDSKLAITYGQSEKFSFADIGNFNIFGV